MGIEPGLYNINNGNNNYAMMMYANNAENIPIVCVPNPNGQTQFTVEESGKGTNRYIIKSDVFKYNVGAAPDNLQKQDYPFTSLEEFEWSIEPAGTDLYKIHIPNMDAYWFLPDGPSETRILIQGAQGRPAEIWKMVKVDTKKSKSYRTHGGKIYLR
ncbi:unnamed protein product [Rhizoctonia solani]|uniref:Uncharacterized protein n=3 Tax=Rhizoctonia solani TaxID=456999 RepID=A0A8H3HF39_9AGAM|nr:hypothetical protein RSOL_179620 [Rhizoctonia solani AG-3 Rhs1AP]KEP48523.1 hypothetical protein V565_122350 [Rhizoctonia solani 123E]CAE6489657.1 unnamed protein product [Rhizoctonia solani]CAE6510000.1 unnamed protein product [Rhizoctonia solani]